MRAYRERRCDFERAGRLPARGKSGLLDLFGLVQQPQCALVEVVALRR